MQKISHYNSLMEAKWGGKILQLESMLKVVSFSLDTNLRQPDTEITCLAPHFSGFQKIRIKLLVTF